MGFFDLLFTSRSVRGNNDANLKALREPKSKWYRVVQVVSIILIALGAALIIMSFFIPFLHNHFDVWLKISLVMIALGGGGLFTLPWVNFLERNKRLLEEKTYADRVNGKFKYVAFAFLGAIGVCILLWIIAVFTVHVDTFANLFEFYFGEGSADILSGDGRLAFLAVAIILSLQVGIASYITTSIFRFRKKFLVVRVIQYVSLLLLDIWGSWLAGAMFGGTLIKVNEAGGKIPAPPINLTQALPVIAILAVIALLVTVITLNKMVYRERMDLFTKGAGAAYTATDDDIIQGTFDESIRIDNSVNFTRVETESEPQPAETAPEETVEQKLEKIADLRDRGVITEEEYRKKRQDIIDGM